MPLLSTILWLPVAAAIVLAFFPRGAVTAIKGCGLFASLATFVISLGILPRLRMTRRPASSSSRRSPGSRNGASHYGLGVDGISLWLVLLTTFLAPVVFLSSWNAIHKHPKEYVIAFLVMETAMIGAFLATDLLLFYVFFELMLLPMYLVIGVWGGANRIYAAIKFFLFTIAGSLLMLLGIIYLVFQNYHQTGLPTFAIHGALRHAASAARADAPLLRLRAGLRDQGAALPAAHLAAGRARRSADRRLDHPRRRHAEDGHVRLPPLRPPVLPRRLRALGAAS